MKRIVIILAVSVLFLSIMGCGASKYPLNGIWSGVFFEGEDEVNIHIAFIDDLCFMGYERELASNVERVQYTYENGHGIITYTLSNKIYFERDNNTISYSTDGINVVLNRDESLAAAPSSISGIWKDDQGWIFAFINNRAYISRDRTTDFGIYSINKKEGFLVTVLYHAPIEFFIKNKKLDAKVNNYEHTFLR